MEYIRFALSEECRPEKSDGVVDEAALDRSVLDDVCKCYPAFLTGAEDFLRDDFELDETSTRLLESLTSSLGKVDPCPAKFVLSLSGGVDSMSLLVLLLKVKIDFAAVHIRHSSRLEDTKKELEWVQFVCNRFSVPLYYHHVQVARPHATSGADSEISRDQFEQYTRDIRFAMYQRAYRDFAGDGPAYVLIGHHLDDIDENRIAELGKGNLVNIDGMAEDDSGESGSCEKTVVVLRPLCNYIRKETIRRFAKNFQIPHMHNSTPKWSKRGWIRDVLDEGSGWVIEELNTLGIASKYVDELLDQAVHAWLTSGGITSGRVFFLDSKSKSLHLKCSVIDLNALNTVLSQFEVQRHLDHVVDLCSAFAPRWNEKVAKFASSRPGMSCPIQKIPSCDVSNAVVLTKCFQKAFGSLRTVLGLDRYIARKSVSQLTENLAAKTPKVWINWKINNVADEFVLVQVREGVLIVFDSTSLAATLAAEFGGNREAMKKTVINNVSKIRVE